MRNGKPTPEDIQILYDLKTYHYLTAQQVCDLHYSHGSLKGVMKRLKDLETPDEDHPELTGYVVHIEQEYYQQKFVYILDVKGVKYLRSQGADMSGYFPSEHKKLLGIFRNHFLTTNDVLITASKLPKVLPAITSVDVLHDLTLKRMYQGMRPDGWIDIHTQKERIPLWIEIDMGTMDQKPFREKIRKIVQFVKDKYESIYGTPYVTVVFLTPKGEKRVAEMLRWIENELAALGEGREADLFRVGEICDDPLQMWTGTRYRVPFIADHEQFYVGLPIPIS